jgi:hypothetical protein
MPSDAQPSWYAAVAAEAHVLTGTNNAVPAVGLDTRAKKSNESTPYTYITMLYKRSEFTTLMPCKVMVRSVSWQWALTLDAMYDHIVQHNCGISSWPQGLRKLT